MATFIKDPRDCKHTVTVSGHWEPGRQYHGATNSDSDDWFEDEWVDGYEKPTTVDISVREYQCTRCGKIWSY